MGTGKRVLLVEDDDAVSYLTALYLRKEGHEVEVVENAQEMLSRLDRGNIDLILLDLGLPDEDGLVMIRRVRTRSRVPIIVVTARRQEDDKLTGLELGADDYVTKPYNPRELILRVRNLLARCEVPDYQPKKHQVGPWQVDIEARTVESASGQSVELTRGEFNILASLVVAPGRVVARSRLLDALSYDDDTPNPKTIDVLIYRLRRKLEEESSSPKLILTVPGIGYRLGGIKAS